jgi:hypothetical protein
METGSEIMGLKEVLEAWKGVPLEELLRELYIDKDMNIADVAKELRISTGCVHGYLVKYGIKKHNNLFE